MPLLFAFFVIVANWMLKLLVAWIMFSLLTWFNAPMWVVIAGVAVAATETKIIFK